MKNETTRENFKGKLLTVGAGNPKTAKGAEYGVYTAVMHFAPMKAAGRANVCPHASAGCGAACLNTAGRGGIFKRGEKTNNIQEARKARTRLFYDDRPHFWALLIREIRAHARKAVAVGLVPVVRLNGTSDIRWESETVDTSGAKVRGVTLHKHHNIMSVFSQIQFYDYTKDTARIVEPLQSFLVPSNYHLTASRSETNESEILQALGSRGAVAVVFDTIKGQALPETWHGFHVVDGDKHDATFMHAAPFAGRGVVIGLRSKGKARKDASGFSVDASGPVCAMPAHVPAPLAYAV